MRLNNATLLVILVFVVIVGVFLVNFLLTGVSEDVEGCVDLGATAGFVYDVCYDSYTQNVFMLVRGGGDYDFDSFEVSFFDGENRSYDLGYAVKDVSQLYKFYAAENPLMIELGLGVVSSGCDSSRYLSVRFCSTRRPGSGEGSLNGSEIEDYFPLAPQRREEYPNGSNYTVKEIPWVEVCESDWVCGEWEDCDGDLQRRSCEDLNGCAIPVGLPDSVRYCGDRCFEDWDCAWGNCVGGFMEPVCSDLNNCGTEFDKPRAMSCDTRATCTPDIFCERWSDCDIDYGLLDLVSEDVSELAGTRSRLCGDSNNCVESRFEVENCTVGVDVYTGKFNKCGDDFIGVYNSLNDDLIARIKEWTGEGSYLDIYFDDRGNETYCDYCFNGVMDEDETGVDCGGSCGACGEKYVIGDFVVKGWWDSLREWLGF